MQLVSLLSLPPPCLWHNRRRPPPATPTPPFCPDNHGTSTTPTAPTPTRLLPAKFRALPRRTPSCSSTARTFHAGCKSAAAPIAARPPTPHTHRQPNGKIGRAHV